MKKISIFIMAILLFTVSCSDEYTNENEQSLDGNAEFILNSSIPNATPIPGSFLITLKDGTFDKVGTLKNATQRLSNLSRAERKQAYMEVSDLTLRTLRDKSVFDFGIDNSKITKSFSFALNGFVTENLTDNELETLRKDPRVDFIEQNYKAETLISYTKSSENVSMAMSSQTTPWGITRVGGSVDGTNLSASAWVIDSGIDLDHEDLNVDVASSVTFVTTENGPNDFGGHGTHVAGTIAAKDNGIGVIGVAAGANVIAVKVLNAAGGANFDWVTSGIDYVTANASNGDVANLSLGYTNVRAWDRATRRLARSGVKVAIAAGNDYSDCSSESPARVNHSNAYTVSSIAEGDYWSNFSNYGSPVDYAAPGSNVLSTTPDNTYDSYNGTSMATPHVAGILLLGNVVADGVPSGAYWEYECNSLGCFWTDNYSPNNIFNLSLYRYDVDGNDDPIATHGQ